MPIAGSNRGGCAFVLMVEEQFAPGVSRGPDVTTPVPFAADCGIGHPVDGEKAKHLIAQE